MSIRRVALAVTAALAVILTSAAAAAAAPIGAYTTRGAWSFASAPDLHPPKLRTDGRTVSARLAAGDFLVDNFPNVGARGPMIGEGGPLILDSRLQPVWVQPVGTHVVSADLQQATYQGQPVLDWWQGLITRTGGTLSGQLIVVDQHYRRIATLRAKAPWVISIHDAEISGGSVWVTVYRNVRGQNLKPYGGSRNGTLFDSGVQQYDLKTGRLIATWDARRHVPLSDSGQPASAPTAPGGAWDAYHVNSIQLLPDDQLLVSMRNTSAAYLIDASTGRILWTLGGKHSSFSIPSTARFSWQHDVQLLTNGNVTLFDDACCEELRGGRFARPDHASRGLVLRLDQAQHTVSRVAAYSHGSRTSAFLGSMQLLPNGNALVGWGSPPPYFTEFSRSGRQLLDAVWPGKDQSYRALFTSTWVGTPFYPPSAVVRTSGGSSTVYASWNGATQVARWEVLGGSGSTSLAPVATKARTGFETAISLGKRGYNLLEVSALDSGGHVLGTSKQLRPARRSGSGLVRSY